MLLVAEIMYLITIKILVHVEEIKGISRKLRILRQRQTFNRKYNDFEKIFLFLNSIGESI